ncbi:MAG: secretion protein HlyD [Proteobacteria bacterium]|nr:secretion protein HlyD [Pseudomonadota bacterium]
MAEKKWSFLVFTTALIGAVIFIGYYFYEKNKNNQELTLHGNVDIRQVDLGFRVSGRLETMLFEEGDSIKKGELLATLDKIPFEHDVANLRAQVDAALANLKKLNTGNRPQEIQEALAKVNEKQVTYENAKKSLNRKQDLLTQRYASKQEYDDAYAAANEAQAQLKSAQEALKLIKEGYRAEDIAAGGAQLEAINAQLATALSHLQDTDLRAPNDGVILTRIKEPGAILPIGTSVYTLSLVNPVWVRAYVSEQNLGLLKPGMNTLIYTDSAPNKPYHGQIGFISPQAEFTPKNIETKELRTDLVYRLRITVQDEEGYLRQGMPVTVVIPLSSKPIQNPTKQQLKIHNEQPLRH